MIPEASERIVSFVLLESLIPRKVKADSAMLRSVFPKVGRALSPMKQSASTFKCSYLTSTVGRVTSALKEYINGNVLRAFE